MTHCAMHEAPISNKNPSPTQPLFYHLLLLKEDIDILDLILLSYLYLITSYTCTPLNSAFYHLVIIPGAGFYYPFLLILLRHSSLEHSEPRQDSIRLVLQNRLRGVKRELTSGTGSRLFRWSVPRIEVSRSSHRCVRNELSQGTEFHTTT